MHCIPSTSVVIVIQLAKKAIKKLMDQDNLNSKISKYHHVLIYVKKMIGTQDMFDLKDHALTMQYEIDNHSFDLISSLVKVYFDLLQHDVAKVCTVKHIRMSI